MALPDQPQFFDPAAEYAVTEGRLPHWEQARTVTFITFRTWDSMPREVIERFLSERDAWLRARGIEPSQPNWKYGVIRLPVEEQTAFRRFCSTRWEGSLDQCYGSCPLRIAACSQIVASSLRHFDGERYLVFDYVVMPNHVHVLAAFPEVGAMRKHCGSWKHFTATRLNKLLGRTGRFWEDESFDHLTRSEAQFEHLRDYIAENPVNANLRPGQYAHYSRDLPGSPSRTASPRPLAPRVGHTQEPLAERADHTQEPLAERADNTTGANS